MRLATATLALLLNACTITLPSPGGSQEQSQKMTNKQSQEQAQTQTNAQDTAQQSSHASESKQGTNSMPVIVICNQLSSSRSTCASAQRPLSESINELRP